jgi:3-dehydroquinate synthetase
MVYAAKLANRAGLCDARVPERIEKLVSAYDLPVSLAALKRRPSAAELVDAIQVDKKAEGGKVRFVLPTKVGQVVITKEWEEQQLRELLAG